MSKPRKTTKPKMNPAYTSPFPVKMLQDGMGTLMVTGALLGCTFNEKLIVATLIPLLLKFIRTAPKKDLQEVTDKLFSSAKTSTEPTPKLRPKP